MSGLVGYQNDPVKITTGYDTLSLREWSFKPNGDIQLPLGGDIVDNNGNSLLGLDNFSRRTTATITLDSSDVIWTGTSPAISSAKLLVQIECQVAGDFTGPHTQSCEIIIASRGSLSNPAISVYGIIYTSISSLATFTAQRNINGNIEVVGTTTEIVGSNAIVKIYSVEQLTGYP